MNNLKAAIEAVQTAGFVRLFSLRHEFPTVWAAYKVAAAVDGVRPLEIKPTQQHFPFQNQTKPGETHKVVRADLIAQAAGEMKIGQPDGTNAATLVPFVGDLKWKEITEALKPPFAGEWHVGLTAEGVEDAWLLVQWG